MTKITITYLNGPDIDKLAMTDDEILDAVDAGLIAAGRGQTVIEPRVHLTPDPAFNGHFNVLRGYVAPLGYAGVKIVGHSNMAGRVAVDASALYSRNLYNFVQPLIDEETKALKLDWEDEILKAVVLTRDGKITHPDFAGAKSAGSKTAKKGK